MRMSLTLTFLAIAADGTERVLSRTIIPDEALVFYQSSPEIALTAAQSGEPPRPDGFRVTDDRGRIRASSSRIRKS